MAGHLASALVVLALSAGIATAQIDVTGRWHVTMHEGSFGVDLERSLTLTQSGATVTVAQPSPYSGGTIDPVTGALHLDGVGYCGDPFGGSPPVAVPWTLDVVVSPDGMTFAGTSHESMQPTRACLLVSGPTEGVKLPETCGNGVVDPGEVCDGGLSGSACCTEFCTARPAGWFCSATGPCVQSGDCDGAGACVPQPKPAGTLCRFPNDACDTAEFCDGIATTCPPPYTPTEPDVDGDGILEPCDNCVGPALESVRLRVGRLGVGPTKDFISLRARVHAADLPNVLSQRKLVEMRGADGVAVFYDHVPGGPYELGGGWRRRGDVYSYKNAEPEGGLVDSMRIAPVRGRPGVWDVRVKTSHAILSDDVPVPPLTLRLILDGLGSTTSARCGELQFGGPGAPSPSCSAPNARGLMTCR
jgi:hypothetical protein